MSEFFEFFSGEGVITRVLRPLRSGKEATVYLCAGGGATSHDLVAIKEYAPIEQRTFRNDAAYQDGMLATLKARDRRALASKSRYGKTVQEAVWQHREWEHLRAAYEAGCNVPEPLMLGPRSIAMQYIGDRDTAAPQLQRVRLGGREAAEAFDAIMNDVERLLAYNLVHGDLSAFNVLWWDGKPFLIDLPQAIDPRLHRGAEEIFRRDVERICDHFARQGLRRDADAIVHGLWTAFLFADL